MLQQTVQGVWQRAVRQKICMWRVPLQLFIIISLYVCSLCMKHWVSICSQNVCLCTGISVCSCVFLRGREGLTGKNVGGSTREKKRVGVSQTLSRLVHCSVFSFKLFISLLYWQPCLDDVNCRVQSVWWLTHFRIKVITIYFNRILGLTF